MLWYCHLLFNFFFFCFNTFVSNIKSISILTSHFILFVFSCVFCLSFFFMVNTFSVRISLLFFFLFACRHRHKFPSEYDRRFVMSLHLFFFSLCCAVLSWYVSNVYVADWDIRPDDAFFQWWEKCQSNKHWYEIVFFFFFLFGIKYYRINTSVSTSDENVYDMFAGILLFEPTKKKNHTVSPNLFLSWPSSLFIPRFRFVLLLSLLCISMTCWFISHMNIICR